ncbi:MAG: hybrid sensor histidine kinase/response regulator [Gemmatimonadaceae bacterium]
MKDMRDSSRSQMHAGNTLRAVEARWRAVFESAGIGIAIVSPNGVITDANPALCRILGYEPGSLDGTSSEQVTHPDDLTIDAALLKKVLLGRRESYELEKRYRRLDGTTVWGRLNVSAVRDEDGVPLHLVGVVEDITAARAARGQVLRGGGPMQSVVEHGSDVVAMLTPDGEIRFIGPAVERLLGYTPEELEGRNVLDLVRDEQRARAAEALGIAHSRSTGAPSQLVVELRHRDGSWRTHEAVGTTIPDPLGGQPVVVVNSRDVTDRVDALEALKQAERRFRNVVEQNLTGIYVIEGGRFVYANPRFCEIFGYTLAELQALESVDAIVAEESREAVRRSRADRIAGDESASRLAFTGVHASGRRLVLDLHATASVGDDGLVTLTGTVLDVTEQRALEAELRQRQKMEAIGQLAGGVAHDFNNLLTVIQMNLDFAREALPADSQPARDLAEVARAADLARALTGQLLAFGRQQTLSAQAVDQNDVVRATAPLLQRLAGEDVSLVTELAEAPCVVRADVSHVEQVLMSLAVNARDAILGVPPDAERTGRITVRTAHRVLDTRDAAAWPPLRAGEYVELRVKDTGPGMSPEVLSHAFEPFFTTKPLGRGTGLGLSTVFGVAAQSGGAVRAESAPGEGATFTVLLPCHREPASARRPEGAAATPGAGTILLAEDERSVRRAFVRGLERLGYEVLEAEHGLAALERWEEHGGSFAALVTDIRMPEMGGLDLAAHLRKRRPRLPVVFVSGYSDQDLPASSPWDRFLTKPITPARLGATLCELLAAAEQARPK